MNDSRTEDYWMLPIQIAVRRWNVPLSDRDRDLLAYALRNASDEIVRHPLPGATVAVRHGAAVFLFDLPAHTQALTVIEHRCRLLRSFAKTHFYADLTIGIGDAVPMRELSPEAPGEDPVRGSDGGGRSPGADYLSLMRKASRSDDEILRRILAYVEENLSEPLTREEIAQKVHFHPAYLSRLFRKKTGMSLSEYISQIRIERAKELLSRSEQKVSFIMNHLGYYNLSHFTRTFKKMTGYTPQQYRKRNTRG